MNYPFRNGLGLVLSFAPTVRPRVYREAFRAGYCIYSTSQVDLEVEHMDLFAIHKVVRKTGTMKYYAARGNLTLPSKEY